jgi:hypothetical protein
VHDAIAQPAHLLPEAPVGAVLPPVVEPLPATPPQRSKPTTTTPPMDELDTGWDLGDEDPTADPPEAAADEAPPSSSEMAGDGAVEGDGLDQVDWPEVARSLSNVVGFDDSPFDLEHRGDVRVVGAVCARTCLDGVLSTTVRRDGSNATDRLIELVQASRF